MSEEKLPMHYLGMGEYHVSRQPERIVTVVGSCLALTMFHARTRTGAMLHAVLPHCNHQASANHGGAPQSNCVTFLFYMMLEKFKNAGAAVRDIEFKAFGGASSFSATAVPVSVGARNIEVFSILKEREKLNVLAEDMGGTQGRKVILDTTTGDVFVKFLRKNEAANEHAVVFD